MSTEAKRDGRLRAAERRLWEEADRENHYQLRFRLERGATLPTRATGGSAGYDLAALGYTTVPGTIGNDVVDVVAVDTGVAVEVPEGHVGIVALRSSVAATGLVMPGSVGVIDSDYRGTVKVPLMNVTWYDKAIVAGQRIAQLVVVPCLVSEPIAVAVLPETARGDGGFGSTGE